MLKRKNNSHFVMLNECLPAAGRKLPDFKSRFFAEFIPHLYAGLRMTMVFVIVFIASNLLSQPFTNEEKKILEMQDKRIVNYDIAWMTSKTLTNSNYAIRQIAALQNVNDSTLFNFIIGKYEKSNTDSKKALLEYLKYFDTDACRNFLLSKLHTEEETIKDYIIAILPDVGNENTLSATTKLDFSQYTLSVFVDGLFRYSKRRIGSITAFEKSTQLNNKAGINPQEFLYALNRTAIIPAIILFKDELKNNLSSTEYTTRMWSFSAIGKLQDTADIPYLLKSLADEKDWRVKVNIVNALGNYKIDNTSALLAETATALLDQAIHENNTHISIASLQALGKLFAGADTRDMIVNMAKQELMFILSPSKAVEWQIKAEAIRTYAKMFRNESKADLLSLFSQTDNYDIKAAIVGSFAFMDDAMIYKELRDSISADVMRYNAVHPNKDGSMIGSHDLAKIYKAFVDALAELDNKLDTENKNIIRLIFSEFASSKHPAIVDVCLTNLQDSMYLQYRGETCQIMMFDYESFSYPKDKDVTLMYIQAWDAMKYNGVKELLTKNLKHKDFDIAKASADALKNITGKDYEKEITAPKYRTDFDWGFIDKLGEKKIAVIKTNRGDIKIELFPNIAPFTVQNFVKLGEKGYYNNTIFHRVVPNFVIQGGDPTGTGYGGPGYSIRSEFSPLSFEEYTVGMASSGKDTEGSQFFITHSPQPHLDGKYTLFGKVIEGFDVVDKIQIGDKIEAVTFTSTP